MKILLETNMIHMKTEILNMLKEHSDEAGYICSQEKHKLLRQLEERVGPIEILKQYAKQWQKKDDN